MHEYGLVGALLARVDEEARRHGATRVGRLHISIGELSGVDPESLARAYETFREGTICAGAPLEVRRVPARWTCGSCAQPLERGGILRCAACGAPGKLDEGDELFLERIEMEVP